MSKMDDINKKLEKIKSQLEKMDFSKKDILESGQKIISKINNLIKEKEIVGTSTIGTIISSLNATIDQVNKYDIESKKSQAFQKYGANSEEYKNEIAKGNLKSKLDSIYQDLNKKQKIFEEYSKLYDPQFLIGMQERKLEANKILMESNNEKLTGIAILKEKFSLQMGKIEANNELQGKLNNLDSNYKKYKKNEEDVKNFTEDKNENEKQLELHAIAIKKSISEINSKYHLNLEFDDLESKISEAKNILKEENEKIKSEIKNELEQTSEISEGLKKIVQSKFDLINTDKEYINIFNNIEKVLLQQSLNSINMDKQIRNNIEQMKRGYEILKNGENIAYNENISEEEILKLISTDKDIETMKLSEELKNKIIQGNPDKLILSEVEVEDRLKEYQKDPKMMDTIKVTPKMVHDYIEKSNKLKLTLTDEERAEKTYSDLIKDKKGNFHPILFLKSLTKKAQRKYDNRYRADVDKQAREELVEKLLEKKVRDELTEEKKAQLLGSVEEIMKKQAAKERIIESRKKRAETNSAEVGILESKKRKFLQSIHVDLVETDSKDLDKKYSAENQTENLVNYYEQTGKDNENVI